MKRKVIVGKYVFGDKDHRRNKRDDRDDNQECVHNVNNRKHISDGMRVIFGK